MDFNEKLQIMHRLFINRYDIHALYIEKSFKNGEVINIDLPGWRAQKNSKLERSKGKPEFKNLQDTQALVHHVDYSFHPTDKFNQYYYKLNSHCGSYSADEKGFGKFAVIDLDTKRNPENRQILYNELRVIIEVSSELGLNCYPEISRSGLGIHIWYFMVNKIHSGILLHLMNIILEKAKKQIPDFTTVDRPIPDTVTGSEFGKSLPRLVGLPLNMKLMEEKGATKFIHRDSFTPIDDQWEWLSTIYENGRITLDHPVVLEATQRFNEYQPSAVRKVTNNNEGYWEALSNLQGQFQRFQGCEAIVQMSENTNIFNELTWQGIVSNIAVYGLSSSEQQIEARDLVQELSREYINNDADKNEKKFFDKLNYLQKIDSSPTACKTLSDGKNWTCPKFEDGSCKSNGVPAKFGAPTSFLVYDYKKSITVDQRLKCYELEQKGLYKFFQRIVYTKKIFIEIVDKESDQLKEIAIDFSESVLLKHLLGIQSFRVKTTNDDATEVRSVHIELPIQEMDSFEQTLISEGSTNYWRSSSNSIWLIFQGRLRYETVYQELNEGYALNLMYYPDPLQREIRYAIAPFYNALEQMKSFIK